MKKIAILLFSILLLAGCQKANKPKVETIDYLSGLYSAKITVKDYGEIEVLLDADEAPITVTNFVKLVKEGYYDGLTFHRIIEGFMIQGGASYYNPKPTIKGEFAANGVVNNISHTRGTISMARSDAMDSASTQFFIVHQDSIFLDGKYAGFGHVTKGMDVVDKIATDAKPINDNGMIAEEDQPIIEKIEIIEEAK